MTRLAQRPPRYIRQETYKNMCFYAILSLVPGRPNPQVTLVNAKRRLSIRQLHVRPPQLFAAPVGNIGT